MMIAKLLTVASLALATLLAPVSTGAGTPASNRTVPVPALEAGFTVDAAGSVALPAPAKAVAKHVARKSATVVTVGCTTASRLDGLSVNGFDTRL